MCEGKEKKCSRHCSCENIKYSCYEKYPSNQNSIYDARALYRRPWYQKNNFYYGNYCGCGHCDTYLMDLLNSDRGNFKQA